MSDPLGFISRGAGGTSGGAQGAYGPDAGLHQTRQAPSPDAPNFKDVLMNNIRKVNQLQQDASTAIEDLQTGKRDDVEGVLLATQKADTAFRVLVSVRNKVQQAYDEIKQLRV